MANPFLMDDLNVGDTQVSSNSTSFNPFLSNTMDFTASNIENPFMSTLNNAASANTNPFAFTTESSDMTSDFFSSPAPDAGIAQSTSQNYENIFASAAPTAPTSTANGTANDFFGSFAEPTQPPPPPAPTYSSARSSIDHTAHFVNENVNLFGVDPIEMSSSREGSGTNTPRGAPPRRPPPPRPGMPPSKETKDLILSVTGAMEATSSHLLDRLQATRTPSPTPMRDLNSPSPTPDMFGDFLDVENVHKEPTQPVQEVNLLGDMDDFEASVMTASPVHMVPIAPAPTSVPPVVPVSPAAHPSPVAPLAHPSPFAPTAHPPPVVPAAHPPPLPPVAGPPPKPPPPKLPPERPKPPPPPIIQQIQPVQQVQQNIFDLPEAQPPAPVTTNTTISSETQPSSIQEQEDFFGSKPAESILSQHASPDTSVFGRDTTVFPDERKGSEEFTSVFDAPTAREEITQGLPAVTAEIPEDKPAQPVFSTSAFDEPRQEPPFPTSPFEQPKTEEVSSFASGFDSGFDSEMNISVIENPPAPELSMFGAPSSQANDLFLNESDSLSFQPQTADLFAPQETVLHTTPVVPSQPFNIFGDSAPKPVDDFDAFSAKFESVGMGDKNANVAADPFGDPFSSSPFGPPKVEGDASMGFGADDNFDSFLAAQEPPPVPQSTPARFSRGESADSDDKEFSIFIKPKQAGDVGGVTPALAPPPKSPVNAFQDSSPRFNPFDKSQEIPAQVTETIFAQPASLPLAEDKTLERTDSQETPPTPLFDEDVSQPLEPFPRIHYTGLGWEMQLRQPNKKKITGQRFWKKVFMKLVFQGENPVLQLFNNKDDKDPFQELPLQPCYSVSDIGAQQYDVYGKIFTVKLQFIFYKERPGVRPGQVTKAERITNKLSKFAAYAIQGDYEGVKEFGSDLKKLGLPVEHAPQISQLFKIGSQNYEDMKQFSVCIEEALFRLPAHRDRALNYKMEEVQITAVDELWVDQNKSGGIVKQIARVRLFFLGFLSGMPDVELGVNDLVRQGKEVVGRHDIIPVVTEEWIRLEAVEFHSCVQQDEYERTRTIKFKPPDACYIELMRFRVRPPRNRELPLQLRVTMCITGNKVDLRANVLVPGFSSRKLGQIPCEDVCIRIPIPECWIYLFRVEKHFRYGSVKSAHRRTGKVKGLERFLGAVDNLEPQLMEATSGVAKYEHQHRAIVWRIPRLPKEGQGAYTQHDLVCHMALTSYDQIPEEFDRFCWVEFTMPVTQVSHTTVRSVSINDSDSDTPPEKYVRQLARHEYRVEIEFTQGEGPGDYIAATSVAKPAPIAEEPRPPPPPAAAESDSDSSS
ncbi:protein stoned-B [Macrosteles quadrilineatus]|uniref:protein stoned-B n=1 Tax=Macrosteles quadrilineatus TaxID=74068 RepID=UPI0023E16421|nr:protein stoned-B [Macrosteles quadrilineatus]